MKNRLRVLRKRQAWTQAELAKRLEVSRQTIISIEQGDQVPSLPLAIRVAGLFGKDIEDIFYP